MRILLFFALFLLCGVQAFAQCDSKFSITDKKKALPGQRSAAVSVRVDSPVKYTVKLISRSENDSKESVVKQYSSSGGQTFRFDGLSADALYRVSVDFSSDAKAVCTRQHTDFFDLNKNQD